MKLHTWPLLWLKVWDSMVSTRKHTVPRRSDEHWPGSTLSYRIYVGKIPHALFIRSFCRFPGSQCMGLISPPQHKWFKRSFQCPLSPEVSM